MKRLFATLALVAAVLFPAIAGAGEAVHRIAVHVDQNDPAVINMALNNVQNVKQYYADRGEPLIVEVVAYGPGLEMLLAEKSTVRERISAMSLEIPDLQFSACGNTYRAMSKKAGKDLELVAEAKLVESGVVRLTQLQEEGYTYIKP